MLGPFEWGSEIFFVGQEGVRRGGRSPSTGTMIATPLLLPGHLDGSLFFLSFFFVFESTRVLVQYQVASSLSYL